MVSRSSPGGKSLIAYAAHVPSFAGLAAALDCPLASDTPTLARAIAEGGHDTFVLSVGPADRGSARPLVQWTHEEWMAAADQPQFDLLSALQAIKTALGERQATVVLIGPSIAHTGAANHAALATASEGQRGLMKSVARQWGLQVRFAWLSVWTPLLFPDIGEAELPEQPELGPYTPTLGGRPGWAEVAAAVHGAVATCAAVTGQTTIVDGGEWMLP
jgi:hypothetical protein